MAFDLTVSFGNVLTIVGFIVGGILAVMALKTNIALLAQRVGQAETNLRETFDLIQRVTQVEIRVSTIWEFMMRRAKGEAVNTGLATLNSPIKISDKAREIMDGICPSLQEYYRELPLPISDEDLTLKIEQEFGDRILREVCIPNKLSFGACLIIAVQVARERECS